MVISLRFAFALVGCLTVVGCAAEPATRSETPVADDKAPPVKASTSSNDDRDDGALPVTPVDTDAPTTEDRLPPAQGGDEAAKPSKPPGTTPTPAPAPSFVTKDCRSEIDGHVSLAKVTYSLSDGVVKITKMTFVVTNKDQRPANDADVFLTQKGGSETKMFWTQDILESGKTVEVTDQAKALAPKAGAVLRVETNFDKFGPGDPHADCTINF